MKLTTITHVSVDGVMQGLGGADEDRREGFDRGGWALPLFTDEGAAFVEEMFRRADGFLFGRHTFEIFAAYWGVMAPGSGGIPDALNAKPKYVVSTTQFEPGWADTAVLSGDVAQGIEELRARPGGELQVHGSGALVRWLMDNDLVDEMILLTYPVIVGQGTRLFPDAGRDMALDLVESRTFPRGITMQGYRPAGRPEYAS